MTLEDVVEKENPDFDIPPTKKQKREYFGRKLIDKWEKEFKEKCWFTPHFPYASLHVLVGQLPNIKNMRINVGKSVEDCRIHLLLLQESGSGKGGGFSFMADIAKRLNIIFHTVGDITNSSLVGSIKPVGNGKTETVPGALSPEYNDGEGIDILASNEASSLVDTTTSHYNKNAILNLQRAMNTMGTEDNVISKETGIGNQTIKFNTDVSLFLTTFEPEKMFETITKTGFFQRLIVIYNPVSLKDKIKVAKRHVNLLENGNNGKKDYTDEIIHALRYINNAFDGVDDLHLTDDARDVLREKILPHIYEPLIELDSHTMHEVKKFTTRYQVMLYKIAWHHAILRLSRTVEVKDMAYARKVFIPIYKRLLAYMENKFTVDKEKKIESKSERKIILNTYYDLVKNSSLVKKDGIDYDDVWVKKPYMVSMLAKKWNISREGARHKLEKHNYMFDREISSSNAIILNLRDMNYEEF